jgi:hypothetical protein
MIPIVSPPDFTAAGDKGPDPIKSGPTGNRSSNDFLNQIVNLGSQSERKGTMVSLLTLLF